MGDTTRSYAPPNDESEKIFTNFGVEYDSGLEVPAESRDMIIQRRTVREDDTIYDLTDVIEEPHETSLPDDLNNQVMEKVSDITERIAREMFPAIAERIIREEIDKLKNEMDESKV